MVNGVRSGCLLFKMMNLYVLCMGVAKIDR